MFCATVSKNGGSCTAGDTKGFTDTYLEAIKLQRTAQKSVGRDANAIFEQALPYEILIMIFGYLTAKELCRVMTVSKVRNGKFRHMQYI